MKPGISVCFIIKNAMINGYPFWESLQSCLPFADEIVISEGYSQDETMSYVNNFKQQNGRKVKLFRDSWDDIDSPNGEVIAEISNKNLRRCQHEWIYYLQADEIIHPFNHAYINMVSQQHTPVNSVEFWFVHFIESWEPIHPGKPLDRPGFYNVATRMVRNKANIYLRGDAWNFGGGTNPALAAELAPEFIYHLGWVFADSIYDKRIEKARLYTDNVEVLDLAEEAKANIEGEINHPRLPVGEDQLDIPPCIKRLIGMRKYQPPSQAFFTSGLRSL